MIPNSINSAQTTGKAYTATVTMPTSGEVVVYRSVPMITIVVPDVMTGGTSVITTTLKLTESVTVNGKPTGGWENLIRYKNITAKIGCGINTSFVTRARVEGNCDTSNPLALIGWLSGVFSVASVSNILSALELLTPSGSYVSTAAPPSNIKNYRAIGASWKSNVYICTNSHDLYLEGSIATVDSALSKNVYTNAAAQWNYDIFVGNAQDKLGESLDVYTVYVTNKT